MRLNSLLKALPYKSILNPRDVEVEGIAYHSKAIKKNYIFVAIQGARYDGKMFISEAIANGASVVVADKALNIETPLIVTDNPRRFLAELSLLWYNRPDESVELVGITGTNGKTTTAHLLKSILEEAGKKVGMIGTIGYFDGESWSYFPQNTTPESLEIVKILAQMIKNGVTHCVMEVSSHALALDRVWKLNFDSAIFTNLSQDHLDFHLTMENYKRAKLKLFEYLTHGFAVLNRDDPYFKEFSAATSVKKISYGFTRNADVWCELSCLNSEGSYIKLHTPEWTTDIRIYLLGRYNIYNVLGSAALAFGLKIKPHLIRQGIEKVRRIPGRLESVDNKMGFHIFIDYAHTPDALKNLISSVRAFSKGRIIVIFGCGGERDRTKRGAMGRIASELADFVILTSDNPRNEEPSQIIQEIIAGIEKDNYIAIENRREAIFKGVSLLKKGDVLLVAGKGHENYQIIGNKKLPFDDKKVVEEALNAFAC